MDLSLAFTDPNISEAFVVLRSSGHPGAGGWVEDTVQEITAHGTIGIAASKDIETLPEADVVHGAITINTRTQLFVTHDVNADISTAGTSDIIVWQNENYRILKLYPYRNRGYWWAVASRMAGN